MVNSDLEKVLNLFEGEGLSEADATDQICLAAPRVVQELAEDSEEIDDWLAPMGVLHGLALAGLLVRERVPGRAPWTRWKRAKQP